MMENFTPISSLAGGVLIGIASALLLVANGRIAGISGITGGLLAPKKGEIGWRAAFLVGMVGTGLVTLALLPSAFALPTAGFGLLALAGLLVGVGTSLGSGCTSGHGVCGIGRFSKRSIVATATFMFTAGVTVFVLRHLMGVV